MMPWHCTGIFSSRNFTGMSLSCMPARITSERLVRRSRNLVQTRNVIFVVLDGIERH